MTGAFQSDVNLANVATSFGVVPADLTQAASQNIPYSPIPEPLTFITYMFLHAGWMHLISNMLSSGSSPTMWKMPLAISPLPCFTCCAV